MASVKPRESGYSRAFSFSATLRRLCRVYTYEGTWAIVSPRLTRLPIIFARFGLRRSDARAYGEKRNCPSAVSSDGVSSGTVWNHVLPGFSGKGAPVQFVNVTM